MIFIAFGANLPSSRFGAPHNTLAAALRLLSERGVTVVQHSRWYESEPVPPSDQPWYINGVAEVTCDLSPGELLTLLHGIEAEIGRLRGEVNAARSVDLDLLDYEGQISPPGAWPVLPHPRMAERAFVLLPLLELAPDWRHPVSGLPLSELVRHLPAGQVCRPLRDAG